MEFCLECGDKILGRSDKKFCNDSCRNSYNNRQRKASTQELRKINDILRKNFCILRELPFVDNIYKTNKPSLERLGFSFTYFTHIVTYKNGAEYRFIYSFGYKLGEDDFVLVVKK